MAQTANVRSIDAIKDFKTVLINFAEEARVALSSAEMELNHARNWLERDQLAYWKSQVKRCQEQVAQAKADLFRRKISQGNSDAISDGDQKEALREAQKRLRHAEEMVERVKRWVPILQHATLEYLAQSQPLGDHLSGGLSQSLAVLERMITALEGYVAITAPEAPVISSGGGSSSGSATSMAPSTGAPASAVSEAGETASAASADSSTKEATPSEELAGAEAGVEPD